MKVVSEKEKYLFERASQGQIEEVRVLLDDEDIKIDCIDDNGMSLLQNAAYKGNYDLASLFIERGANVNLNNDSHGYTALMLAGLGGHLSVVNLLLESGANVNIVNSVGRNAAQMSAFVGMHEVVSLINNYVEKDAIDYYLKPHGLDDKPLLPSVAVANALHAWVRQTNIHPVKLVMTLGKSVTLIENGKKVYKALQNLCEKEAKASDPNEMLALKFHYLSFVLNHCLKHIESRLEEKNNLTNSLDMLIKLWIKGRETDGFPTNLEKLLRQSIREYDYRDSGLYMQLVRTLSSVEIGHEPSALTILSQTINGQKGFNEDSPLCSTCGEPKPAKKCSQCKFSQYCDQYCQKLHWFTHKKMCMKLKKDHELIENPLQKTVQ